MSVGATTRSTVRSQGSQGSAAVTQTQQTQQTQQPVTQPTPAAVTAQRVPASAAQVEGTRARANAGDRLVQAQLQARLGGSATVNAGAATGQAAATAETRSVGVVSPALLETTGATRATASQDGIKTGGVAASQQMAATDMSRVAGYKQNIEDAAKKYNVDPAIVAGIISRETRGGAMLDKNGYGKSDPNGFGVMQVDKNNHTPVGKPTGKDHIEQGVKIFAGFRDQIAKAHPDWTDAQITKASISAYNKGPASLVRASADPARTDRGTTGSDYANDVIARAQYFSEHLFNVK